MEGFLLKVFRKLQKSSHQTCPNKTEVEIDKLSPKVPKIPKVFRKVRKAPIRFQAL
jgi:hypothetical protein